MVPNGVLSGKLPANGGAVRPGVAGGAVAIVGQDPAALDQSLVEGTGFRPRHRGDFGLVGEDRKSGGAGHHQSRAPPTRRFG